MADKAALAVGYRAVLPARVEEVVDEESLTPKRRPGRPKKKSE